MENIQRQVLKVCLKQKYYSLELIIIRRLNRMRDRDFAERLQQIKAKYGYAHHNLPPKATVQPQYARCRTPTMFDNPQLPQTEYTSQRAKLISEIQPNRVQGNQPQRSRQLLKEETSFYGNNSTWENQGQSPIVNLMEISSSPIKRFGGNLGRPNSSRNSISPQNFFKDQKSSPLPKGLTYQPRQVQNLKRNAPREQFQMRSKQNELPSERSFNQGFQTPRRPEEKPVQSYQVCKGQQCDNLRFGEKRGVLDQCNFNIVSIDKIQDRIACALRKNK